MSQKLKIALLSISVMLCGIQTSTAAAPDEHDRGRAEPRPEARGPGPGRPGAERPAGNPGPGTARGTCIPAQIRGRAVVLVRARDALPSTVAARCWTVVTTTGRYYPPVGSVSRSLPGEYRPYYHGRDRYYFNGGIWYAPSGPGFVVVRPPRGLVINVLPPFYSTVWFGGVPYYYADNVYYSWQPDQNGYAVVDPPDDADSPSAPPDAPPTQDLIIYPKNGQSKEQQSADQFECHNWAKGQTGFDPTQGAGGGVSGNANADVAPQQLQPRDVGLSAGPGLPSQLRPSGPVRERGSPPFANRPPLDPRQPGVISRARLAAMRPPPPIVGAILR